MNSHLMSHNRYFCELFGVPRNTWVFAFESALKEVKVYQEYHGNGVSEGECNMNSELQLKHRDEHDKIHLAL